VPQVRDRFLSPTWGRKSAPNQLDLVSLRRISHNSVKLCIDTVAICKTNTNSSPLLKNATHLFLSLQPKSPRRNLASMTERMSV